MNDVEPSMSSVVLRLRSSRLLVLLQHILYGRQQQARAEGLVDESGDLGAQFLLFGKNVPPAGEHDRGDMGRRGLCAKTQAEVQPIHLGHLQIRYQQIGKEFDREAERFLAVMGDRRNKAGGLQLIAQDMSDMRFVVCDQYLCRLQLQLPFGQLGRNLLTSSIMDNP